MTAARNVVMVVPYAPGQPSGDLGASKKIELVARLLHGLGYTVHLVDSSHPTLAFAGPVTGQPAALNEVPVSLWRPHCLPSRKLGKLFNVLQAALFVKALKPLAPVLVWAYNSYSFEARAALALKRWTGARIVLELEDLPLARGRGLNPKPWLDQYFFPKLLAAADLVTFVNAVTLKRFASKSRRALLLPSLLQQALVEAPPRRRFAQRRHRLGYFGGLTREKGAGLLLELVPRLAPDWQLVITGVGDLSTAFQSLQAQYPERLEFHGMVSHDTVLALMQDCDAIVNPHTSIAQMKDGVFPFKVCEALASGALLVSTPLPSIDIDLSRAVLGFDGTVDGLLAALSGAAAHHERHAAEMALARQAVCDNFSEASMRRRLRVELDAVCVA
jgi:glycosyltransferase involved in cell wall biosynthesis